MASVSLTNEWSELNVTTGTIQNLSFVYPIEVSASQTDGSGQVLFPHEAMTFSSVQLYARVATDAEVEVQVRVSPFVDAAGGSGGGSTYVLPAASANRLGGIKVGSGLSVANDGTLSASGGGEVES